MRFVRLKEEAGNNANYLVVDDVAGLMELVQFNALEFHPWGAHADDPDRADRIVFDLDPGPGVPFAEVKRAAMQVRDLLEQLELKSFLRTTGGKGLHVVVPLNPAERLGAGQAVREGLRRSARRLRARALSRHGHAETAAGQDLRRLPAQRARRDRGGLVFAARAAGCAGGDAAGVVGTQGAQARRRVRHGQDAGAHQAATQGSVGGNRHAASGSVGLGLKAERRVSRDCDEASGVNFRALTCACMRDRLGLIRHGSRSPCLLAPSPCPSCPSRCACRAVAQAQTCPASPTQGAPIPAPLPVFPANNWWNTDISQAPVDANSANFINFIGATRRLHPDFGGEASTGSRTSTDSRTSWSTAPRRSRP